MSAAIQTTKTKKPRKRSAASLAKELGVQPRVLSRFILKSGFKPDRKLGYPSADEFRAWVNGLASAPIAWDAAGKPIFAKRGWSAGECRSCRNHKIKTARVKELGEFVKGDLVACRGKLYVKLQCWCSGFMTGLIPVCLIPTAALFAIRGNE